MLTLDHVREMGLDPTGDRVFLKELIELYNIQIDLSEFMCCIR